MPNTYVQSVSLDDMLKLTARYPAARPRWSVTYFVYDPADEAQENWVLPGYGTHPAIARTPLGTVRVDPGDYVMLMPKMDIFGFETFLRDELMVFDVCGPEEFQLSYEPEDG